MSYNASKNNTVSLPFGSGSSARRDVLAELAAVEVRIQAVLLYQRGMAAALRDVAILYDEEEVGDDDARSALQQRGQGPLDDRFRARIYIARRLVQDEDARVCQDSPGKSE